MITNTEHRLEISMLWMMPVDDQASQATVLWQCTVVSVLFLFWRRIGAESMAGTWTGEGS